jgi:intein-encoded DNA endonuclease-like protein
MRLQAFDEFQGLAPTQTRKEVVEFISAKYDLTKTTVYSWYNGSSPGGLRAGRVAKIPELMYVIGALLGDGCICHSKGRFHIWLVGEEAFAAKFATKLSLCLGREVSHYKYGKKNAWFVHFGNAELYFLVKTIRKDSSEIRALTEMIGSERGLLELVEGFFDAEGCVKIIDKTTRRIPKVCLDFCNTDLAILGLVWRATYRAMGICFKLSRDPPRPRRKPTYHLRIYKKDEIREFLSSIPTTKLDERKSRYAEEWFLKNRRRESLTDFPESLVDV